MVEHESARRVAGRAQARAALPGAGALSLGVVVWGVATYLMPWASTRCGQTPLVAGQCLGLSFGATLQVALDGVTLAPPQALEMALSVALGVWGAAIALGVMWARVSRVALRVGATLWLAAAVGVAALADSGVGSVVAQPRTYGLTGNWTGDTGVLIAFGGLALCGIGLGYLWVNALRGEQGLREVAPLMAVGATRGATTGGATGARKKGDTQPLPPKGADAG